MIESYFVILYTRIGVASSFIENGFLLSPEGSGVWIGTTSPKTAERTLNVQYIKMTKEMKGVKKKKKTHKYKHTHIELLETMQSPLW